MSLSGVTVYYWDRVYIYSLQGVMKAPSGWRASDFAENKDHIWAGVLRINSGTQDEVIFEYDPKDGKKGIFAKCLVKKENVEPVVDSSRFFVVTIANGDKTAQIGLGFNEKQAAFDFKHELASLCQKDKGKQNLIKVEKVDYSLKTPITVNVKTSKSHHTSSTALALANTTPISLGKPTYSSKAKAASASLSKNTSTPHSTTIAPITPTKTSNDIDFSSFDNDFDQLSLSSQTPANKSGDIFSQMNTTSSPQKSSTDTSLDLLGDLYSGKTPSTSSTPAPVPSAYDIFASPTSEPTRTTVSKPSSKKTNQNDIFDFDF